MKPAGEWAAPLPREIPKLVTEVAEFIGSLEGMANMRLILEAGRATVLPVVLDAEDSRLSAYSAQLLGRLEHHRLTEALASNCIYYATADTTSLAIAGAQVPTAEYLSPRRPPSPTGFMVFEEPIGGYSDNVEEALRDAYGDAAYAGPPGLAIDTPITAVSWSPWTPHAIRIDDDHPIAWMHNGPGGMKRIPDDFDGIWITFYDWGGGRWDSVDPDMLLAETPDGKIYVRDMAGQRSTGELPLFSWNNELVLPWGLDLSGETPPDTTGEWLRVLYTAWQMMGQTGKAQLTETEMERASRPWRRQQERQNRVVPEVRVVRLHTRHRPDPKAVEDDAATSSGRRAPNYTHRWPVRPYRKSVCLNTHQHADGGCEHEERLFPASIRGPKDKPLKVGGKVFLWDTPPDAPGTEGK